MNKIEDFIVSGDMIAEIKTVVAKAMVKLGAYSNGYATYVDGSVYYSRTSAEYAYGNLEISTPIILDLTGKQRREKEEEIVKAIAKVMKKFAFKGGIEFTKSHIEHGAYETNIKVTTIERWSVSWL